MSFSCKRNNTHLFLFHYYYCTSLLFRLLLILHLLFLITEQEQARVHDKGSRTGTASRVFFFAIPSFFIFFFSSPSKNRLEDTRRGAKQARLHVSQGHRDVSPIAVPVTLRLAKPCLSCSPSSCTQPSTPATKQASRRRPLGFRDPGPVETRQRGHPMGPRSHRHATWSLGC